MIKTPVGRLRILGYLEGISLLVLIFVGVPLKYFLKIPIVSTVVGPIHGALFVLFLVQVLFVAETHKFNFFKTTIKLIVACFIPFGTFYMDKKVLSKIN